MLGRLSALLLGSILAVTNSVQAAQQPVQVEVTLACDMDVSNILELVQTKYGEVPFATATGLMQLTNGGRWISGNIVQTINPQSNSFSLIMMDPETGMGCMIIAGRDFYGVK
jgi:hypothetical protein